MEYYKGILHAYLAAPPSVRAAVDELCHPCPLDESGNACRRFAPELEKSRRDRVMRVVQRLDRLLPLPLGLAVCCRCLWLPRPTRLKMGIATSLG